MVTLEKNIKSVKDILSSQDILVFEFSSEKGKKFAVIYVDGIVDKALIGELVVKPLRIAEQNANLQEVKQFLASPEVKDGDKIKDAIKEISDGNAVLFVDGEKDFFVIGLKNPPGRPVAEPPTQVAVHGPREGFTEDIKVNLGLIRKRIKSPNLQVKTIKVGEKSETAVSIIYIDGLCDKNLPKKIEKEIIENKIEDWCRIEVRQCDIEDQHCLCTNQI